MTRDFKNRPGLLGLSQTPVAYGSPEGAAILQPRAVALGIHRSRKGALKGRNHGASRPFRATILQTRSPGRCPGLSHSAPLERRTGGKTTTSDSSRAFTLVEVLVGLCVFAMAAVVLGSSYLNVLTSYEVVARGARVSADFGFAREQVLREPDRKKLEQGGEFETTSGGRAKWSVEITSTNVPEVFNVAFTYEVSGATAVDTVKQSQQFTLLRPTWVEDVAERDKLKEDMKARIYEIQGKKAQ